MGNAIMVCKGFAGDWGIEEESNIPHEIINNYLADNGKQYIYIPPYGGYGYDPKRKIKHILFTTNNKNSEANVLYKVEVEFSFLPEKINNKATYEERNKQKETIKNENINYNGKPLNEIVFAKIEEDNVYYYTFKASKVVYPKRSIKIKFNNETSGIEENSISLKLSGKNHEKYYIKEGKDQDDYKLLENFINDEEFWDLEKSNSKLQNPTKKYTKSCNLLMFAKKEYDETAYTNLIFHYLSIDNKLLESFIQDFLEIDDQLNHSISREVPVKKGRIDLLIETSDSIIIIENKLKSGLNGVDSKKGDISQLTTYFNYYKDLNNNPEDKTVYGYLLEPNYNNIDIASIDPSAVKIYKKKTYKELYEFFKKKKPNIELYDEFVNSLIVHTRTIEDVVTERFCKATQNI